MTAPEQQPDTSTVNEGSTHRKRLGRAEAGRGGRGDGRQCNGLAALRGAKRDDLLGVPDQTDREGASRLQPGELGGGVLLDRKNGTETMCT